MSSGLADGSGNHWAVRALWVAKGGLEMAHRDEFRAAAASCLDIAQTTTDQNGRARLLMLAQKFIELAGGSSSDHVLAKLIDEFNIDNVCWESDYPHSDSTWPNGPEVLEELFAPLSELQINKITHENAMRHFQFDPYSIRPP